MFRTWLPLNVVVSSTTTEVTARAHIARSRLGLVLRKCPEIPPEHMQGGESLAAQKLRRRRAASGAVFATGNRQPQPARRNTRTKANNNLYTGRPARARDGLSA